MRLRTGSLLAALMLAAGVGSLATDLGVVEFDLYPSSFEPNDLCEILPTWLLDQLIEHSPYTCAPALLTREELQRKRIVAKDGVLSSDAIEKLFRKESYELIAIGTITGNPLIGSLTVSASLVKREGAVVESGTVVASSLEEAQAKMRDLCFALLGLEPPTGNAPPVAKVQVETEASVATPGAPAFTVYRNERVVLDASASYDIDGTITRYEWDLNEDGVVDEYKPRLTCDELTHSPGEHRVQLRVTDSHGAKAEKVITLSVLDIDVVDEALAANIPPVPEIQILGGDGAVLGRDAYLGEEITLDALDSYDPDGELSGMWWDVNADGEPDEVAPTVTTSRLTTEAGVVRITLEVVDNLGEKAQATVSFAVSDKTLEEALAGRNLPPVAYINITRDPELQRAAGSPYAIYLGESVRLDGATSYDPDGSIAAWRWTVSADSSVAGYRSMLDMPDLTALPGQRVVTLEVTDDDGATTRKSLTLTVFDYSEDEIVRQRLEDSVIPVLRRAFMVVMGIGLIAGVGYLIYLYGW